MEQNSIPDGYEWFVDGEDAQTVEIYVQDEEGNLIGKTHANASSARTDEERESIAASVAAGNRGRQFQ